MMLFDASALLNILERENSLEILKNCFISDLTCYEIGNAIWKSVYRELLTEEEALKLLKIFGEMAKILKVAALEKEKMKDVLEISIKESISFYDASYIFIAIENGLDLVTDDKKLGNLASRYLKVHSSLELPLDF
ncbi:MAG: type II toxin-antitoxin system VapC family toxin [Candidatus Hydrothermarchaeota archaeon]